jgi:NAD(P)-dependent dehydrogenase (short-subunit alcohol dehydrogenase family)
LAIWWLTAEGVRFSSAAAAAKLARRAAASKASRQLNGGKDDLIGKTLHEARSCVDEELSFVFKGSAVHSYPTFSSRTPQETPMLLADRVALVTGGAGLNGLGFAAAKMLAAQGARVVITDLEGARPAEAAAQLGAQHLGLVVDVTRKADVDAAVARIVEQFGRIDVLVNNAGITQPRKTVDITESDYDAVLDVSLRGTLLCSQAVIPVMQKQRSGAIVCISSVSAQRGGGILGGPHYSAAKAGVLGLARAMARELGPDNVRVNCITPGLITTDINKDKLSAERKAEIAETIPLARLGVPADVAGAVLFLASDLSGYCTGITLDVNGGMLIH